MEALAELRRRAAWIGPDAPVRKAPPIIGRTMKPARWRSRGIQRDVFDRLGKSELRDRDFARGGVAAFVGAEHLLRQSAHHASVPPVREAASQFIVAAGADGAFELRV